jgi:hypothetical protein
METIITTPDYWDCECLYDYIHSREESKCKRCGCTSEDQPDSIYQEVLDFLKEKRDALLCLREGT